MAPYNVLICHIKLTLYYTLLLPTVGPLICWETSINWDEYVLFILLTFCVCFETFFHWPTCISLLNRHAYVLTSDINYLPCIVECFLECILDFGHVQAEKKKRKAQLQEANRKKIIKRVERKMAAVARERAWTQRLAELQQLEEEKKKSMA